MSPLTIPGAVPGSYISIQPTQGSDWVIKVCEGVDPNNMKTGQIASVKIFGPGKTSDNEGLSTELMHAFADFYHKHKQGQ